MAITCRVIFDWRIEVFANGDDTNLIMERSMLSEARKRLEWFNIYGLECREEGAYTKLEDIVWCQCMLTPCHDGWRWIRDPWRVLNTILCNEEYARPQWRGIMKGIAMGEAATNPGQPIVSPICEFICSWTDKVISTVNVTDTKRRWLLEGCPGPGKLDFMVDKVARGLFADRYGVTPVEQIAIEQRIIGILARCTDRMYREWTYWEGGPIHPFSR
jgi:hypothetical protein